MDDCASTPYLNSRELFRVLDTLVDAVLCMDINLRLTHINPTAAEFFSLDAAQPDKYDIFAIAPEEYHTIHERFLRRCQSNDPPQLRGRVFRLKLKCQCNSAEGNGSEEKCVPRIPVSLSISPTITELGRMFVLIIRRRMSVSATADSILNQDDEIKTSLSSVSHEIRNPLVAIGGFARRISRDPGLSEKSRHKLAIIQDEVGRLERLVNGLNDLSKATAYHFEFVDIKQLLGHVAEIMGQQAAQEQKSLSLEFTADPPRLLLDRDRISQVIINLARNALQACPPGGKVVLQTGAAAQPGFISISITDNGQGITAENLNKLFTPFFTTKKGGTGLGMAVSRRIVEDHGGIMDVRSVFGQGTTVNLLLPL